MSYDTNKNGERGQIAKGSNGEVKESLNDAIEAWKAVFERAWAEQPWRGKRELLCNTSQDLSFDEMVLLLANLMTAYPSLDPTSESVGSPSDGIAADKPLSEVTRA